MHSSAYSSRSSFLVCGKTSVHALLPLTLDAQVESLLENGKIPEAEALLDKAEAGITQDLLSYLHQCIAFELLSQTRFLQATQHFVKGAVDPRVLISFIDELRPALPPSPTSSSSQADGWIFERARNEGSEGDSYIEVDLYAGVRKYMPSEASVDDIIATNLVRNYSPYLRPQMQIRSDDTTDPDDAAPPPSPVSGTRTHPATIAMRDVLRAQAREMVENVLSAMLAHQAQIWTKEVVEIVSTALALHYAHSGDIPSLLASFRLPPPRSTSKTMSAPPSRPLSRSSKPYVHPSESPTSHLGSPSRSFLQHSHRPVMDIRPHVVAPVLVQRGLWGPLIELWKATGEVGKVMSVLAGLVEGTYQDPSVLDPLDQICTLLSAHQQLGKPVFDAQTSAQTISESERRLLIRKWGTWLAVRDVEKGLSFLTSDSLTPARRSMAVGGRTKERDREREQEKADELAVLIDLQKVQPAAAKRYLEWLIVIKGREDPSLQRELVESCVGDLLEYLKDETITKLWRAKAASYASSSVPTAPAPTCSPFQDAPLSSWGPPTGTAPLRPPFLSYFASTTPDSPSKRARIKALLVLQVTLLGKASEAVAKRVQERLAEASWERVLGLEMAILHSKLSPPTSVFRALHLLRDNATAESYASGGSARGLISSRMGSSAAEGCGLTDWAKWFARATEDRGSVPKGPESTNWRKHGEAIEQVDTLKTLVQVYTEDGDTQQASRLLSSHARRLDIVDVFPLVPPSWPVHTVSPFLIRSLRHSLHNKHEGQIVKALCAGQSLEVFESSFATLRDEGAIIEEADEDGDEGEGEGAATGESFDEKGGLAEKMAMELQDGGMRTVNVDARSGAEG